MSNDELILVRDSLPETPLPVPSVPGIAIRLQSVDDEPHWTAVQRAAETFFEITDQLFGRQYGFDPDSVAQRCFLAVDETTGEAVGTCGAWYGTDEWAGWGRIHWVAVRPDYQRRGIAAALLATSLNRLRELGHDRAYLVTSTGRVGAIALYRRYGFV